MNKEKYLQIATKSWYHEYEKFILENIDKLNINHLSINPNITIDFVKKNPQIQW